jgi:hypothetical protein
MHLVPGRQRIRRAVDQPIRKLEALDHFDVGAEIAPELDRLELDRIVCSDDATSIPPKL